MAEMTDLFRCGACLFECCDLNAFLEHKNECATLAEKTDEKDEEHVEIIETPLFQEPLVVDSLTCHLCLKRFKKKYNLQQHILIHSDSKAFQCDICAKTFVQKANLRKHLGIHQNNKKDVQFTEDIDFEVVTKKGRKVEVVAKKSVKCASCNGEFENLLELKKHSCQHESKDVHRCEKCGQVFALSKYLRSHQKICSHSETFTCSLCPKSFALEIYLKKHLMTHASSVIECPVCKKTFKRADNLKRHRKMHEKEAQVYVCPFQPYSACSKQFHRYDKLKDHIKTHGDVKPVKRPICQVHIWDTQEKLSHMENAHGQAPISDETANDVTDCDPSGETEMLPINDLRIEVISQPSTDDELAFFVLQNE